MPQANLTKTAIDAATAEAGAITVEQATEDYALVINICLSHRKYRILCG